MKIDKIVFILLLSCLSFSCGRKETKERMKTYADAEKRIRRLIDKDGFHYGSRNVSEVYG